MRFFFKKNTKFDGVIHFAAKKSVDESVRKPLDYYHNNIQSLINILDHINTNVKFIFSSSCTVYGQAEKLPITEKTPLKKPESPYGNTKKICENILEDKTKIETQFGTVVLRYFNPIGAHHSSLIGEDPRNIPQNLVPIITQFAIGRLKKLTIYGDDYPTKDGTCIRDYIHVSDLADIHIKSLVYLNKNKKSFILNCGYGKGYSVKDIVNILKKIKSNVKINFLSRRPGDIAQVYSNTKKFLKTFKWNPRFNDIKIIIKSAIKWEKKLKK